MPKIIHIDEIAEDMVLQTAVANKFGQVLIGAGVQLTEKHKKILKTWNITNVEIKSDDLPIAIEISPENIDAAKAFIATKIKWKPKNKLEDELIGIAIKTAAIQLKKGGSNA